MVEVNMAMADVPGGNGFVNDFVYEDIPDTTHARIWAVWSAAFKPCWTLLSLKLGLGQSIGSRPC